ncbi:MAG: hypothetical protein KC502_00500 [Myxococcales bacterium]|nr:hypothetical protein [Myxococcales bacterium]
MSLSLSLALGAVGSLVVAAVLPRRETFALGALVATAAAAVRTGGAGAGLFALVAAAALMLAFVDRPERRVAAVASLISAISLLASPAWLPLQGGAAVLALVIAPVAVAAIAAALRDQAARIPLAAVLALLPFPIAAVAPAHVELAVAHDGAAGAWALSQGLGYVGAPAWADTLWAAGPWLLFGGVLVAYARPTGRLRFGVIGAMAVALAVAAAAQVAGIVSASPLLTSSHAGLGGAALPTNTGALLDAAPGLTVGLRLAAIAWLLCPAPHQESYPHVPAMAAVAALMAVAWLAPAWFGQRWMADPAVLSLGLIALIATLLSVDSGRESGVSALLSAALGLAGLLLIGSGELGWRVAGVVMGR